MGQDQETCCECHEPLAGQQRVRMSDGSALCEPCWEMKLVSCNSFDED